MTFTGASRYNTRLDRKKFGVLVSVVTVKGHVTLWGFVLTPSACLVGLLALHAVLWTVVPVVAFETPPLDVLENRVWGAAWEWGYFKHPPLQAWLTQGAWLLLGTPGIYLLSQVCVVGTALGVFLLGRDAVDARTGAFGAILYSLSYYATFPTPEFNANVLQAPLWALSGWLLWCAIQRDSYKYWVGLGVATAAALYAKYSVIFLICGLLVATLALPQGRHVFARPGPYVGIAIALLLCLPHGLWMVQSDFLPLTYALERSSSLQGWERVWNPLKFVMAQLVAYALPFLLIVLSGLTFSFSKTGPSPGLRFIRALAVTPLLAMVTFALVGGTGLRSMWGAPAVIWLGVFVATFVCGAKSTRRCMRVGFVALGVAILLPVMVGGYSWWSATTPTPHRTAWPGPQLAAAALEGWSRAVGSPFPPLILGPTWEAGFVFHFADTPQTRGFFGTQWSHNPWVVPVDLEREGALIVWSGQHPQFSTCGPFSSAGSIPIWHKGKRISFHWAVRAPGTPLTSRFCV